MIEDTGMRPSGAHLAKIGAQHLDAFLHLAFCGFMQLGNHVQLLKIS
jgi:hypothetical protein